MSPEIKWLILMTMPLKMYENIKGLKQIKGSRLDVKFSQIILYINSITNTLKECCFMMFK